MPDFRCGDSGGLAMDYSHMRFFAIWAGWPGYLGPLNALKSGLVLNGLRLYGRGLARTGGGSERKRLLRPESLEKCFRNGSGCRKPGNRARIVEPTRGLVALGSPVYTGGRGDGLRPYAKKPPKARRSGAGCAQASGRGRVDGRETRPGGAHINVVHCPGLSKKSILYSDLRWALRFQVSEH